MRHIEAFPLPGADIVKKTRALENVCRIHDDLKGSLYLDSTLNFSPDIPSLFALFEGEELVSVATLFTPRQKEAEIVGLTHPNFRRAGAFRALVTSVAQQAAAFGIPELLFVCEPHSKSGVAALGSLGATLENTEYSLKYDRAFRLERLPVPPGLTLHRAGTPDLDDLTFISSKVFEETEDHARQLLSRVIASEHRAQYLARLQGEPVGIVSVGRENGVTTIYGLGVLPQMQGRGIGRGIISLLLTETLPQHTDKLLIEVDSSNAGALHLYLSCGFVTQASFGYYRAKTERFLLHQ